MKKITKTLVAVLLVAIMCMTNVTAFASETQTDENVGIMPRLSHTAGGVFSFSATEDGGYALAKYDGYDSFVRADLTVKVEKRFLWAFWNEVDEWSASSTDLNGSFYHIFELNGSGTYRALFTLTITGNDGTVDIVTDTIQSKY